MALRSLVNITRFRCLLYAIISIIRINHIKKHINHINHMNDIEKIRAPTEQFYDEFIGFI